MVEVKNKVLIVDDSQTMLGLEVETIGSNKDLQILTASSWAECAKILEEQAQDVLCALLDLSLPDAPNGEVVDLVVSYGIPSIVYTASVEEEIREVILEKGAMDYVLKNSKSSLDYIYSLVSYIYQNQTTKVLVVDDSKVMREMISHTLMLHKFTVLQASNGIEALNILKANTGIRLMITDEYMPLMKGSELVYEARKLFTPNELCIIGVSAHGNSFMTVEFLKNGANDFITKPFRMEEFVCRILQSITMIRLVGVEQERNKLLEENHKKDIGMLNIARHAALGEFTSNIAHHWRQPLNVLGLNIQVLHYNYEIEQLDAEMMNEFKDKGLEIIRNMSGVIDEFRRSFVASDQCSSFMVSDASGLIVALLKELLSESSIRVDITTPDIEVIGCEKDFKQIVYHIMMNAINILVDKKIPDPVIKILAHEDGENCIVEIHDNGGGVPDEVIAKVFDPFFSTTPYNGRLGMGLFYARTLVEKSFGGTIEVENVNGGALFRIRCSMKKDNM